MHAELLLAGCKAHLKDQSSDTPAMKQLLAHVLLECLQQPQLRSEACSLLVRSIADGQVGSSEVRALTGLLTSTQSGQLHKCLQVQRQHSLTALLLLAPFYLNFCHMGVLCTNRSGSWQVCIQSCLAGKFGSTRRSRITLSSVPQ